MTQQDDSIQIVPDPDKLDRYHRQQLSAMLDGELSPDQARFMLRRLQHDVELADCWERWQLCGDLLRGQRNALLPADFAQKVSAAIAAGDAPAPAAVAQPGSPRLLRWGGGAALAASVAMVALLIGRQAGIGPGEEQSPAYAELADSGEPAAAAAAPVVTGSAPTPPSAAETAPALAGAALAAAQASRRTGESSIPGQAPGRRSDQSGSVSGRAAETPRAVAATAQPAPEGSPAGASAAAADTPQSGSGEAATLFAGLPPAREGIGSDPFKALPMTTASRPWPRANTGVVEDYAVGLGGAVLAAPAWPGRPVLQRHAVAELFGLPPEAASQLPSATAIGARAFGAGEAARAPAAAYPGPR